MGRCPLSGVKQTLVGHCKTSHPSCASAKLLWYFLVSGLRQNRSLRFMRVYGGGRQGIWVDKTATPYAGDIAWWRACSLDANSSVNRAPPSGLSDTVTSPPCAFMVSLTM